MCPSLCLCCTLFINSREEIGRYFNSDTERERGTGERELVLILVMIELKMERYEVLKDIGSGNFGVAKLVRDQWTNELYAVKFIERGEKVLSLFFVTSIPYCCFCFEFCLKIRFWNLGSC